MRNDQHNEELRDALQTEVPAMVPCSQCGKGTSSLSPDLASLVDAWGHLPDAIRKAILTLVETSAKTES